MKTLVLIISIAAVFLAVCAGALGPHDGVPLPNMPQVTPLNGITALELRAESHNGRDALFYRDSFVPPILRVAPGGRLKVTYINDLPRHSTEQCAFGRPCMDMTNLHFHGMEVSPRYGQDDILTMLAKPGERLTYDVYVPRDVPPGLYWYHTHPHGESERQTLDGMSGPIVVEGIDRYVPQLRSMPERILMLRTTSFSPNDPSFAPLMRRLEVGNAGACQSANQQLDQLFTVNGVFRPSIAIAPGERQFWRIVNGAANHYVDISVDGSPLRVVAFDGEPLALHDPGNPIRTYTHVLLPSAGRLEAIVTGPRAGTRATLRTYCVSAGRDGEPMPSQVLADIMPDRTQPRPPPLPAEGGPPKYDAVDLSRVERGAPSFVATFTESGPAGNTRFYINNHVFTFAGPPMATVRVGSYVHWRILNKTHEIHSFHIHQVHFLTYAQNGKHLAEPIWADTVNVPVEQSIDVILDAAVTHIRGMAVFHCHILRHEDKGMMAKVLFKS